MNCLDSSFVVDFLDPEQKHHDDAVEWMEARAEEEIAVPAICAFEVLRGTTRAGEGRFDRAVGFLRTLSILDLDLEAAVEAGDFDGRLHADGAPLGARDTLVAAPVRERGGTLVTRDRDFEGVPGLSVVVYSSDSERTN